MPRCLTSCQTAARMGAVNVLQPSWQLTLSLFMFMNAVDLISSDLGTARTTLQCAMWCVYTDAHEWVKEGRS